MLIAELVVVDEVLVELLLLFTNWVLLYKFHALNAGKRLRLWQCASLSLVLFAPLGLDCSLAVIIRLKFLMDLGILFWLHLLLYWFWEVLITELV